MAECDDAPVGFLDLLAEQCATPAVQEAVFRPLLRWFIWNLLPYVALFVGVHFFTTVGAISLVMMYLARRRK
jgi:hypothetical protein